MANRDAPTPFDAGKPTGSSWLAARTQRAFPDEVIAEAKDAWTRPIVTQLLPAPDYYRAETYHQESFPNNPGQGYCMAVVAPKVQKFRMTFAANRKS